jgi:DNA-binding NarL/FixJ family response regulator
MNNGLLQPEKTPVAAPILVVVEDLIFLSKIQQAARQIGVPIEAVEISRLKERLCDSSSRAVIVDLNHRSGSAVEAAQAIKSDPETSHVQVLGFLSHVQTDLAREARQAGLDLVMARSAFTQQLPELLRKLALS